MNRTIGVVALGIVVGFAVVMAAGPGVLAWWSRPMVPTLVACDGAIEVATRMLVQAQLIAAAIFAIGFLVVDSVWLRRRSSPADPLAGQATAAPPQEHGRDS